MKLWRGCFGVLLLGSVARLTAADAAAEDVSLWDVNSTLSESIGHKDNLLLSDFNKEASLFNETVADLFVYRVPVVDGWEFTGFASGEDRRYWQSSTVDKEQVFIGSLDLKKKLGESWKTGLALQYFYNDQMFDASVQEGVPLRIQSKMHRMSALPMAQYEFSENRRVEMTIQVARQLFEEPLDDYWELGGRLNFVQKFGDQTEGSVGLMWRSRGYDTRVAPEGVGSLEFDQKEIDFGIRYTWDEAKMWKSRARAGLENNEDNGSGIYDYHKWRLSHDLTFTKGRFEAMLQGKLLYYDYGIQTGLDGSIRKRPEILVTLRVKHGFTKRFSAFAEYEHEQVWSTDVTEEYRANTIMAGIEWQIR